MVGGLDNLFGFEGTVAFHVFFLLCYRADREWVDSAVGWFSVSLASAAPTPCPAILWQCFLSGAVWFETAFYTLAHSCCILDLSSWWKWVITHAETLVGAIVYSICVLRLIQTIGVRVLAAVGGDTISTYTIDGAVCTACLMGIARRSVLNKPGSQFPQPLSHLFQHICFWLKRARGKAVVDPF